MLGIAGAGMQALGRILEAHGHAIVGTDYDAAKLALLPTSASFAVIPEADAAGAVAEAQLLIYTDAAPEFHPIRAAARAKKIPLSMLFSALGMVAENYRVLAVTGTHGKSSTTAFLGHIMATAGLDPTVFIGAAVATWPLGNARVGASDYLVIEADEYRNHFLNLKPTHAIITTIDFDHPDFFQDLAAVENSYAAFIGHIKKGGTLVCPTEVINAHPQLPWLATTLAVPPPTGNFPLPLPGQHMQYNATLAITLAHKLGIDRTTALKSLATFPGLARRFETIGYIDTLRIISDYGHHPAEIAATLQATRERYPEAKIVALVEPHTAARVQSFADQFVQALAAANCDGILLYPTFYVPGRDDASAAAASTITLYDALKRARPENVDKVDARNLQAMLRRQAGQYDTVIAFSAGTLDSILRPLVTPTPNAH